jgi:hypothetical protein
MEAGGGLADKAQHSVTRSIQAVLETIAEAVVDQTSFRRVVVILFSQPITPGKGESAAVRSCAVRGLTGPEEARLREYLAAGGEVPSKFFLRLSVSVAPISLTKKRRIRSFGEGLKAGGATSPQPNGETSTYWLSP